MTPAALMIAGVGAAMFESNLALCYDISPTRFVTTNYMETIREREYVHTQYGSWNSEKLASEVIDNERILSLFDSPLGKSQVCLLTGNRAVAQVETSYGSIMASVAGENQDACDVLFRELRDLFPAPEQKDPNTVLISFWAYGAQGPRVIRRKITIRQWAAINENYTEVAGTGLTHLMDPDFRPGHGGQLILWNGPPGTGKTTALRALAAQWRKWCTFHYITDPEVFFGQRADYMMQVLLEDSVKEDHWRVLVLEDTGELLAMNAKQSMGQGFARLLNVVDGMIGQGLNTMVLVTTNEPLGKLNDAVVRPGRCASQIEFEALRPHEAEHWLKSREIEEEVNEPMTVAELFAKIEGYKAPDIEGAKPVGFGFSRL